MFGGDFIKKLFGIIIFTFSFLICIVNVEASDYTLVKKSEFQYEINNFYINGDNLIINGWGKINGNYQNYFDDSTHSYSIVLKNVNTGENLTYKANLLPTDKTNYFKRVTTHRECSKYATYQDEAYCYMINKNIAFEFKIPLSDLSSDNSYRIMLRMHAKTINVKYETHMFAPAIRDYRERNGIRYELYSDYNTTKIFVLSEMLFVKGGPSLESERLSSWHWCSLTGYTLYWQQYKEFTSLQEVAKTSNSYDAETWFKVGYNQGLCEGGRSRAYMGWSYFSWMPSSYTDFDGDPAIIKVTTQNNSSIDQLKTYTAPKGSETKVKVNLYNKKNQTNKVKAYNNGNLVYEENLTYNGTKELEIKFNLLDKGTIDIEVIEPSGYKNKLTAPIYSSSYENYTTENSNYVINPKTPIIVIKDKDKETNIYEYIDISIPYNSIKIASGKPIQTWSFIEYKTTNNEIILNKSIFGKLLVPNQDKTLNYPVENNQVKVDLENVDINSTQLLLNLPEFILDKNNGNVYQKGNEPPNINPINGGRKWYVPIKNNLGKYNYQIEISNIGVNKLTIRFNCNYEVIKYLIGDKNSLYTIKRVAVPDDLLFKFSKVYSYNDLIKVGGY